MKNAIKSLLSKLDRTILGFIAPGRTTAYNYTVPNTTSQDIRAEFIKGYFKSQPSPLRLGAFNLYTKAKRIAYRLARKAYQAIDSLSPRNPTGK